MSDTTPNGTVPDLNSQSNTPDGTAEAQQRISALEKQLNDRTSFKDKQINARDAILKKEYTQDPSKIHSIDDSEMRNHLVKIVFPEYTDSKDPYEDARSNGKLISKTEVQEQVKTEKVKAMLAVAKEYEPEILEKENDFWSNYDATNPRLSEDERYKLAMKLTKWNTFSVIKEDQTSYKSQTQYNPAPQAPVSNPNVAIDKKELLKSLAFNPLAKK